MPNLVQHRLELRLDASCRFAFPSSGIGKEIGDDGTAGVKDVVVLNGTESGHSREVRGGIRGNFLPVAADFACNFVKRSHNT